MGSSLKSKSTRARAARSAKSVPKPRRKPATQKSSKVGAAAGVIHAARLASRGAQFAEQLRISPTQAVREMRAGVPATALRQIRDHLEIAMSVAYVTGAALKDQGADVGREAALALQRCVGDELDRQIERINDLIGGVAS